MTPKLLNIFKEHINNFLLEFKNYDLADIDNDLIQKALETHKLLISNIKSCYTILPKREIRH